MKILVMGGAEFRGGLQWGGNSEQINNVTWWQVIISGEYQGCYEAMKERVDYSLMKGLDGIA